MPMLARSSASLGPVGAGFRERDALLERGDAIRERDVARHVREQLGRFVDLAGRERRLGRLQRLLAGRRHQLAEELAHLRLGYARP